MPLNMMLVLKIHLTIPHYLHTDKQSRSPSRELQSLLKETASCYYTNIWEPGKMYRMRYKEVEYKTK